MIYFCCDDERRRNALKGRSDLNGIDFLEVYDDHSDPFDVRQRTLYVHLINPLNVSPPGSLPIIRIDGGERIKNIKVMEVLPAFLFSPPGSPISSPPDAEKVLVVRVSEPGDFSVYTLRLIADADHPDGGPPPGYDPILSNIDFSFKVACRSDVDCKTPHVCPPEIAREPDIDYLAKDYSSFRQLMLDRMAVLVPSWRERNPSDLGIALIELLAYVGDHLSYRQDAIATEAYLATARRRVSVRRHARLVDYLMHDGCNARVWIHIQVKDGVSGFTLKKGEKQATVQFLTKVEAIPQKFEMDTPEYEKALTAKAQVFEPMHDIVLFAEHNKMSFHTWGSNDCCLPKGAVKATLLGKYPDLHEGDVLVLAEVRGPQTGEIGDADPSHRHAVRLQKVKLSFDPLTNVDVTEIEWDPADALPFPLCVSGTTASPPGNDVSVAYGNIVLADHGRGVNEPNTKDEATIRHWRVPPLNQALVIQLPDAPEFCEEKAIENTPVRFRPKLKYSPVTQAAQYNPMAPRSTARSVMNWGMKNVLPEILLFDNSGAAERWNPQRDLLNSGSETKEFVVEVESDGTAYLRFGDDKYGLRPKSGLRFKARYRVGNGVAGNVGANAIFHLAGGQSIIDAVDSIWNPLPARGGKDPESLERVRQDAPHAFQVQQRAVTLQDYEEDAKRCRGDIQRAAATFRWTGSWRTVFLSADRLGGGDVDAGFESSLRKCLERYRMAGHDLEVDAPRYVSLEIEMIVCVKRDYLKSHVKAELLDKFSNRILQDGTRGVFHPDRFTFGKPVFLSLLYAEAQATAGVDSVEITKFQRQGIDSTEALDSGKLKLGRLEIARLDNDPNYPEHGVFTLKMAGGR